MAKRIPSKKGMWRVGDCESQRGGEMGRDKPEGDVSLSVNETAQYPL